MASRPPIKKDICSLHFSKISQISKQMYELKQFFFRLCSFFFFEKKKKKKKKKVVDCHCFFFGYKQLKKQWYQNVFCFVRKKQIFFEKFHQKTPKSIKNNWKNSTKWKKWENNVRFELNKWRTSEKINDTFFFDCHCFFGCL